MIGILQHGRTTYEVCDYAVSDGEMLKYESNGSSLRETPEALPSIH
jgi:hypothetical protein